MLGAFSPEVGTAQDEVCGTSFLSCHFFVGLSLGGNFQLKVCSWQRDELSFKMTVLEQWPQDVI